MSRELSSMKTADFPVGKLIFSEGDFGNEAYRILSGLVEISIEDAGGRVVLATLGADEIFGEMAMIENRPRSASARVLEAAKVEVITRSEFELILERGGAALIPYLNTIFERLRQTNHRLRQALQQIHEDDDVVAPRFHEVAVATENNGSLLLEPDSEEMSAQSALQSRSIGHYPFYFGRRSDLAGMDHTASNQLLVADRAPYRVSRKHCSIESEGDQFYVYDHTSKLGTIVNGTAIGGKTRAARVVLNRGANVLILGGADSQIRFKLTLG